ncbi:MAG TPA: hypothetical protein EYP07_02530, partial [Kiloniellaceae bacterium]|nr:hypothetical protein [Kiloniellaceae bacterium]
MEIFTFKEGSLPLLVSMPHSGTHIPPEMAARMTDAGRSVPDTDWHIPELYGFLAELDVSVLQATHSRYVVDLNRTPDGAVLYAGAPDGLPHTSQYISCPCPRSRYPLSCGSMSGYSSVRLMRG